MTTTEIIFRVLWGLVNANVAIAALYFYLRGYSTYYILTRFWKRVPGKLIRYDRHGKWGLRHAASMRIHYNGNDYNITTFGLWVLKKETDIHVFVRPSTMETKYDSWQGNGKGFIFLGVVFTAIALIMFYFLGDPVYHLPFLHNK